MNNELIEKIKDLLPVIETQGYDADYNKTSNQECFIDDDEIQEIIDLVDQSQWIKVSNRLPEFDIGYLVFVEVVDILNGGSMYINQIAVYSTTDKEWLIDGIVTHWQSLPKQPD